MAFDIVLLMGSAERKAKLEKIMKVSQIKIKFLGKTEIMFRVLDQNGEVLFVGCDKSECEAWIAAQ